MTRFGLPHSEILGSKDVCSFPRLIAACHVLHRLYVPRHSPYALNNFTKGNQIGRHTSELQSHSDLVCRLLLEKKKNKKTDLC